MATGPWSRLRKGEGRDRPRRYDAIWPESERVLDRIFADVPEDEARKMTWDNVVALYGIRIPETVDA